MKFYLKCKACGEEVSDFREWFQHGQVCPTCGHNEAEVIYPGGYDKLLKLIKASGFNPKSVWGYFDFLPLKDSSNIVSSGEEGIKPINHWEFLEQFARDKYNINIKVYGHRHDLHQATGTFKDLAGTVVSSVLKEQGIDHFVAASTGNIGVAYARYLAAAGINLSLFLPETSNKSQEAQISSFGQNVYRVNGDYAYAKKMGREYANRHGFLYTAGNFDPMRLEAKKTMVYEWLRLLPEFPTVFMQAVSGGSGPLGVAKACKELEGYGVFEKMPRMLLPQPERCAPMAQAWEDAKARNFPEGWQHDYPVLENPLTTIETLSTGNPKAYPSLSALVKESEGEFISSKEEKAVDVSRLIAYETTHRLGPAAAITVVGFFDALREKYIKDGDVVMLNIGEGINRSPLFTEKLSYSTQSITHLEEIMPKSRKDYAEDLWLAVDQI